jgi:ABC-2 type transport system permease protein
MLYGKYVKLNLRTAMQYKTNTLLMSISQLIVTLGELLSVWIMFQQFQSVGYWGFYETALMFGIITVVFSAAECFGRGYDEFANLIRSGDLDRLLVRPVNLHLQIFGYKVELAKAGRILLGIIVCIIALVNLNISWTFFKVAVLVLTFLCGFIVIIGVQMIGAGISVFSVENLEFVNIITNGGKELSFYPINIYSKWLAKIFTFILPFACFNYLPISYLMGYGELPQVVYALSPALGMLFIIPCVLFFNWCITKYQSTGN